MTQPTALVVHTRMPAFDRDSGSQDVDNAIRWLTDARWDVRFVSREPEGVAEKRHAQRLRQAGVAAFAGFEWLPKLLRSHEFDLVLISFWEVAAEVIPLVHELSPRSRVVVNSMDLHFLRAARRSIADLGHLDPAFGTEATGELNTYTSADAVLAVSDKETALLADFIGAGRIHTLPLAERIDRSSVPLSQRRGICFVGNFRHIPNQEAVAHLAHDVLPLIDPDLLARHPVTVIGNHLDQVDLRVDPDTPGLELVGWVPSVEPYVERARLSVVPLLHGAGVKRKVLQSMMAYTPVVTTPTGAEGLDLVQGEHALVACSAGDMAAGLTRALTDDDLWQRLATAGAEHIDERHGFESVGRHFLRIVDRVMATPPRPRPSRPHDQTQEPTAEGAIAKAKPAALARATERAARIRGRVQTVAEPGAPVLMVSLGDPELAELGSQPCWPFPEARDGGWAGFDPVDSRAAITHLEAQRTRGARFFVLPAHAFSWRSRYPEFFAHLGRTAERQYQDDHVAIFDLTATPLGTPERPTRPLSVQVIGTHDPARTGPATDLVAALGSTETITVRQTWRPDPGADPLSIGSPTPLDRAGADLVVHLSDNAVLPDGVLARLAELHDELDVDRIQLAHASGPATAPPLTERHRGVAAREFDAVTSLPLLSVRGDAPVEGPVVVSDEVTIGLRELHTAPATTEAETFVRRLWLRDPDRSVRVVARPEPDHQPEISVLISTFERPALLRSCLESFADQTIDQSRYEVVLVDDGSADSELDAIVEEFADRLQIVGVRAGHAGRSAAKNLCVAWSRAPLVLFFDDDDRATPDYLERHLAGHAEHPDPGACILGHTNWDPDVEVTPLMHFVTDVDRLMFSYRTLTPGQELGWKGFWEGRISCKRSLLVDHALHDQRLAYSIDVEMAWRLAPHDLRIVYDADAISVMSRPLDFEAFADRTQAKGKALAIIAALHPGTDIGNQLDLADTAEFYRTNQYDETTIRRRVAQLEARAASDESVLPELHECYRRAFRILHAKGVAETTGEVHVMSRPPTTVAPYPLDPELQYDRSPDAAVEPVLSITIPVWSRTEDLARMVERTVERIWEVARLPTEIVCIDNGSPFEADLKAKVYRYAENMGVSIGWNAGIRLSTADTFVVMNSDNQVEPGWDEALYEAVHDGRRVAFPYTDHCDGRGFTVPDQGATAGWCFMMTRAVHDEVGVFDEWFSPAFLEDTDYWHRAWQLGILLEPVPAARVVHARRTTSSGTPHVDWLLTGHRYKYGWKHGCDPMAAPPYYNRDWSDYVGTIPIPGDA